MKAYYRLSALAMLLLLPFRSQAVSIGDLMGRVTDIETGEPVAYAKVVFENNFDKVTVTANEYGYYYASHIPEGRYQMRVVYYGRIFFMNRVKVYDSYANDVDFLVSCNDTLPQVVMEKTPDPLIKVLQQNDIVLTSGAPEDAAVSLSDVLLAEPGVDIYRGKVYIKGAEAKIFIDGTPIIAPILFSK